LATARGLVAEAARQFAAADIPSPRADAEALLAHALSSFSFTTVPGVGAAGQPTRSERWQPSEVRRLVALDEPIPDAAAEQFLCLVDRRCERVPLQHLTGVAPFRYLELAVGPGVFVPRPETELLAQVAIDRAREVSTAGRRPIVVDLGTGSGAIALAVATEVPDAEVWAVELDAAAYRWAERNIAAQAPAVHLVRGDARTALPQLNDQVGVVVSNPPYIPPDAIPHDREVAEFDPPQALYGLGPDGLTVPRGFTEAAARLLRSGGLFAMEHAEVQADAVRQLIAAQGSFTEPQTRLDLTGRARFVVANRR